MAVDTKPASTDAAEARLVTIPKSAREEIRLISGSFHGVDVIGCRVWYRESGSDECKPSKKGIVLRPETWGQLMPYLEAALQAAGVDALGDE